MRKHHIFRFFAKKCPILWRFWSLERSTILSYFLQIGRKVKISIGNIFVYKFPKIGEKGHEKGLDTVEEFRLEIGYIPNMGCTISGKFQHKECQYRTPN